MKELSVDIESFSSVDLAKCGVYKYAEDAELLLLSYSVDGGPVETVDVACGEEVPEEILAALADGSVLKWAHQAAFERVFLSIWLGRNHPRYFSSYSINEDTVGRYLDPASWRCSRVWCAYMGLPLSLESAGAALGLDEQKMKEGKDLIRYFCRPCAPTKANGGRTRNLPRHAPDKWETFKRYNVRDVEVEMEIQRKLSRYPVPDFIWDEYALDQEVNDRGIAIDLELVRNAILFDEHSHMVLMGAVRERTGVENPGSVQQMKKWLAENGVETESLDKKAVAGLIETAPPEVAGVLRMRQQLARSSVKKYQKMEQAVCDDGRARGMFQFYGANRTGRWCLAEGSPVLVKDTEGNVYEKPIEDVDIADLVFDGESWVRHEGVVFSGDRDVITWDGITATPEHKVFIDSSTQVTLGEAMERRMPIWKPTIS